MKYLKYYEDSNTLLYRKNDIIICVCYKTSEIFLVLKDAYVSDEKFTGIYIGCITKYSDPYYNIAFNESAVCIEKKILNTDSYRKVNDIDKNLMCNVLFGHTDIKTTHYLNKIKEICGINLIDLPELKEHELKMSSDKFNI